MTPSGFRAKLVIKSGTLAPAPARYLPCRHIIPASFGPVKHASFRISDGLLKVVLQTAGE
jgi:hypothetical protein